jgi:hypothetical protein
VLAGDVVDLLLLFVHALYGAKGGMAMDASAFTATMYRQMWINNYAIKKDWRAIHRCNLTSGVMEDDGA